ncbi:MAG: hypothetical protein J3R72DRAFT_434518 [Linnemannia gamsii]|nr:MAG: hypothetical protein J3R72DRAFT_434518 [Linnemannia gamsii]
MERLYPMIEIRYINSFEPQHLQSRQQQELREEPCLHSLSWVHYWSAAKESQVLQSRIVNEVVRVRPMWVNNELLHRNYTPPPQFSTSSATVYTAEVAAVDDDLVECLSPCLDGSAISPSPSVYIGSSSSIEGYDSDDYSTNLEEVLRGVPSSVSIETLVETDSAMDEPTRRHSTPRNRKSDNKDTTATVAAVADSNCCAQNESDPHGLSKRRPSLSRTQSSHDIRHDGHSKSSSSSSTSSSSPRRSKKSRSGSSSSSSPSATAHNNDSSGYRRSVSTPLLLLTRGSSFSNKASSTTQHQQHDHQHYLDRMDSSPDSDTNMSPPLSLKSSPYSSSTSNLSSSSSTSSMAAAAAAVSMGFGHRLAGLAHRLGVYRVRGSTLMVVDM